ncbi:MAG TPA: M28 family peptidase [Verrucomicrobiae bacterium]|nr:M28 family peptidase [Verrucomicrobiae bacterium]
MPRFSRSKSPSRTFSVSAPKLRLLWSNLCSSIGERRAGSAGDGAAGHFILNQFRASGLEARAEPFQCASVVDANAHIALGNGSRLRRVPARVLAGSPSTRGTSAIETDLAWIEMPEQASRLFQPALRDKVVILFGPMPTQADLHRRLVACRPALVIHVDDRLPFDWVKDDGVYPAWVRRYGMPPTVTIPYRAAWELRKAGASRARVKVTVELRQLPSNNLVGEITGRRPELPVVLIGAHHDTQCNNTGADDNASGVVALLVLADLLSRTKPLRTVRFVSFGAEEQLSVGSAEYVRAHKREIANIGTVLNLDSVASPLGHHWLLRAGSAKFGSWLAGKLGRYGLDVVEKSAPMPFADHFPFSAFGVPSVTFMRPNMDSGMRWQHHSAHDNLDNVSTAELGRVVTAVAGVTLDLANSSKWKFPRGIAPDQQPETARLARELFGFKSEFRNELPTKAL